MPKTWDLVFKLQQKEVLNSNSAPSHFIVKGNTVSKLRTMATREGIKYHPQEVQPLVEDHLEQLQVYREFLMKKTRLKKRLKREATEEELPSVEPPLRPFPTLVEHCSVRLTVQAPTRRRMDPPNLWPSLKALEDGLTDIGFWPDDDFKHILETSFRYGGLSQEKGTWILTLSITEITSLEGFVTDIP